MLLYVYIIIGILILFYSGELLVSNSSKLAKKLGLSQFFIGLTVVAFGTSLPELFVSLAAVLKNSDEISVGNIIGSNIANLGLVLAFVFLFCKKQDSKISLVNKIFFFLSTILFFIVSLYGVFLRLFVIVFLILFFIFIKYSIKESSISSTNKDDGKDKIFINIFLVVVSIFGLYFGSNLLVDNGVKLARILKVSELLIGVTVMAVGTSLPELTASIVSVFRKNYDISIANIIGSNIFNVFFVLPLVSIVKPIEIKTIVNFIEFPVLVFMTLATLFFIKKLNIKKYYGLILLFTYLIYMVLFLYRK